MNIANLLVRSARVFPEAPALCHGKTLICTYRGLNQRALRIAGHLAHGLGLAPGDRVGVFMKNCPEYLETLYGIWHAGLVAVPINAKLHVREALFALEDADAGAAFVSADLAGDLAPLLAETGRRCAVLTPGTASFAAAAAAEPLPGPVERGPDDIAWLFYTSGTTGRPKGVMLTNRNLLAMTMCYFSDVDPVDRQDSIVYAAPISHGAGMYNFAHVLAAANHVVPESGGFNEAELVDLAAHYRRISLFAAPTMVKRLVDHVAATGADASGFKTIVYGGGPMYVEDIRKGLAVMGDRFVQIYGQGESPMTITALSRFHLSDRSHPRYAERIASVGVAQSLVEVRVSDAEGNPLPIGETGEVLARGDTVMAGYWRNPEATAKTLRDGWLFTGDMGALDADGFLTLKDRSKDVIISGGTNIYPREVEEVLLTHPSVAEVSVIGRKHPEWGEEVVAFVATIPGTAVPTAAELDALCLAAIARFKRPKAYRFVASLPKNNYGKVLKTELRDLDAGLVVADAGKA
ncbi:MAG TPA: AMP-binding protein [Beijerinckiaceae bacterium]|nr:AMP-binding protein [Beijerinckiaceae bacterium]